MKLYFENSNGERRIIAEVSDGAEAMREINSFCDDRNFKIYYVRTWEDEDGYKVYDVGSWDEFFLLDSNDLSK